MLDAKTKFRELGQSKKYLYLKLQLPIAQADSFLANRVLALTEDEDLRRHYQYFFFVRYAESGFHLRLRFFGTPDQLPRSARDRIWAWAEAESSQEGRSLRVGRYRGEWRRYGGRIGVRFAERLSSVSSHCVLSFLSARNHGLETSKLEFALASGEALLSALGLSLEERDRLFGAIGHSVRSMPVFQAEAPRIAAIFEQLGPAILSIRHDPRVFCSQEMGPLQAVTERFASEIGRLTPERGLLEQSLGLSMLRLSRSYLHMHCNRLGLSNREESLLYLLRASQAPAPAQEKAGIGLRA
jgi:lantibiotic biosynthesis protein